MAEILSITPSAVYRSNDDTWDAEDYRVGFNSGNTWRSKIVIPVGSFAGKSKKLVVQLTIDRTSYPAGAYGVLSENGDLAGDQIISSATVGGYYNAPHADLLANAISQSYSYSDPDGASRVPSSSASSGYTFYFVFDTENLKPNTTYYVYSMRNVDSGSSTAFTVAKLAGISASVTYEPTYTVRVQYWKKDPLEWYDWRDHTVLAGSNFVPESIDPPKGYETAHLTSYTYWGWEYSERLGTGIVGVDGFTVDRDIYVEVFFPPSGSFINCYKNGQDIECEVFQYKDGVDILVNLLYNKNGTDIEI